MFNAKYFLPFSLRYITASFVVWLLSITLLASAANAQDNLSIPDPQTPYISDFANLIAPETEARLTDDLTRLRAELDVELAIVTIETRYDYGNWLSIEDFSNALFNDWGVGNDTRNDGVLILVSRSDREMRIELGESYGPIFDDRMKLVIDHHFIPYFRGDEYSDGIESGTLEAIKRLQPTYDIHSPDELEAPSAWRSFKNSSFFQWLQDKLGLLAFFGIAGYVVFESKLRSMLVGLRKCPHCRQRELNRARNTILDPSEAERGQEEISTYCSNCSYRGVETRDIPSLSESRKRGVSRRNSFGGGRSSGGGASGSW